MWDLNNKLISNINSKWCNLLGHSWRYLDYSNHIKENGDKYDFVASRNCKRCEQNEYFYNDWKAENKSPLDYESDYFSLDKIDINNITYK